MRMNTLPCNIVLLPDPEIAQRAIAASEVLAAHDAYFTLKFGAYYSHASIYMFQLNTDDVSKVEAVLAEIAQNMHALPAQARCYKVGDGFDVGYIDAEYERSPELAALQDTVVASINPLRAGMREKDVAKMQDATGLKLENLQKYGYPSVGKLFRPHVTLTRLTAHKPEVLSLLPDIATFNGSFTRLGLYEMGNNGTCVREITTFELRT